MVWIYDQHCPAAGTSRRHRAVFGAGTGASEISTPNSPHTPRTRCINAPTCIRRNSSYIGLPAIPLATISCARHSISTENPAGGGSSEIAPGHTPLRGLTSGGRSSTAASFCMFRFKLRCEQRIRLPLCESDAGFRRFRHIVRGAPVYAHAQVSMSLAHPPEQRRAGNAAIFQHAARGTFRRSSRGNHLITEQDLITLPPRHHFASGADLQVGFHSDASYFVRGSAPDGWERGCPLLG